jgi:diguanylate cyclase (GGDEF)-like protein/PAS domain S-box-containing protein
MRSPNFRLKLLLSALVLTALGVAAFAGFQVWRANSDAKVFGTLAREEAQLAIRSELAARARGLVKHIADAAAPPLNRKDRAALNAAMQPFVEDPNTRSLLILDPNSEVVYVWRRGDVTTSADTLIEEASGQITAMYQPFPDTLLPRTVGSVRVSIAHEQTLAEIASVVSLRGRAQTQLRSNLLWTLAIGLGLMSLAGLLAWWAGRRLTGPLTSLVRSVDRIGQGDYSRPVDIKGDPEFAELQETLERTRQRLRHTTITRTYLNSVLGGISDAVFVTSPEGVIKMANQAACRLLTYGEEELVGKSVTAVLDESERPNFDLRQAANEARETLVRTRQGQTIPVFFSGSVISSDDPQFQGIIFVARNITDRKRAERRIRYLARYDTLTKVPNRMQFQHLLQQSIARALRTNTGVALLYLDVDRFKEINDTFGHSAGDRTLEILAERLTRTLPKDAIVGRLAGDEFAVFCDGLATDGDNRGPIAHLARSVLNEISKVFQLAQNEVYMTASIGIALAPQDAENVIDLIRNADAAMYYSKQNGGNTFAFYAPEMNSAAVERLMLKSKLRRALEKDELVIRYQPKVDIRTGRIVGAEALLRWRLPGHGDIPPSQFIPLAEETNLILDIGEWVLNRVCSDYRSMQNEVPNPGRVALNLSLKQLRQASFILRCRSVFRKHSVSPTSFELEITETTLMADIKRTVRLLDELYAMGLHLAIDDFGTGYSSLAALQQFPIGTLKIDQSFVSDVGDDESDATIVRTIIEMGRSLGMQVVAEGVESVKHLEFLRAHQCFVVQGRLFGEPCTAQELLALLVRQHNGSVPFAALIPAETHAKLSAPASA